MNKSVASGKLKNKKTQDKKLPIIMGALSAISIFILGFGVMLIMYNYWQNNLTDSYADLKGLFDYKASLWGDAFCLYTCFFKKSKIEKEIIVSCTCRHSGRYSGICYADAMGNQRYYCA